MTSIRFKGCDLSRTSGLMRGTPSKVLKRATTIVNASSIAPCASLKVHGMTQGFMLHSIDSAGDPLLPALRELLLEYQRWLGIDLCFQDFDSEMAQLPGDYAPPDGRLYIALIAGEPAGCIALRRHDDAAQTNSGEMKRLYLRPAYQGQGLGKLMAQHIISDAKQIGYARLLLDTLPQMQAAQGMYEALGFKDTEAYVYNPVPGTRYMALTLS
jgi:putative acetyltransferase